MLHSLKPQGCLQGPDTDPKAVAIIREAIKTGTEATVRILNYRCPLHALHEDKRHSELQNQTEG